MNPIIKNQETQTVIDRYARFYPSVLTAATELRFFTPVPSHGVTMAEAGYMSTMASARQVEISQEIASVRYWNYYAQYPDRELEYDVWKFQDPKHISTLIFGEENTKPIPYYGFVAWLQQAIDGKKRLQQRIRTAAITTFMNVEDNMPELLDEFVYPAFVYPEYVQCEEEATLRKLYDPKKQQVPTFEELFTGKFSEQEYATYLFLLTQAAEIGKFIHPGKEFSNFHEFHIAQKQRKSQLEQGTVAGEQIPILGKCEYSDEDVQLYLQMYEQMQQLHRSYEEQLNYYKATVENLKSELEAQYQREYRVDTERWTTEKSRLTQIINEHKRQYTANKDVAYIAYMALAHDAQHQWNSRVSEYTAELEARRATYLSEASQLRIFVPEMFRHIQKEFGKI